MKLFVRQLFGAKQPLTNKSFWYVWFFLTLWLLRCFQKCQSKTN